MVTSMGEARDRSAGIKIPTRRVVRLREHSWLDQTECFDSDIYDSAWNGLINDMLRELDGVLTDTGVSFVLRQIKEKLGHLRCHYRLSGASDDLRAAVDRIYDRAVERSGKTCIECAAPASVGFHNGWIGPLCQRHAAARS